MTQRTRAVLATAALTIAALGCEGDRDANLSPRASEAPGLHEKAKAEAEQATRAARKAEAAATRGRLEGVEPR